MSNESVRKNLRLLLGICLEEGKDIFLGSLVSDEQFGSDSSSSSPAHHGASQIHQETPKMNQCHWCHPKETQSVLGVPEIPAGELDREVI